MKPSVDAHVFLSQRPLHSIKVFVPISGFEWWANIRRFLPEFVMMTFATVHRWFVSYCAGHHTVVLVRHSLSTHAGDIHANQRSAASGVEKWKPHW